MLTGSFFDSGTADCKTVHFRIIQGDSIFLAVFFHIAVSSFICKNRDSSRLENVFDAEKLLRIAVGVKLVFIREVKVDIRSFIAVKAKKSLKRNIMSVTEHISSAVGTVFLRQVKA